MFKFIGCMKNSSGLTIMEMLVAISIALLGAMGAFALLTNVVGTVAGNAAAIQAQQEARYLVENMARELRESSPYQLWLSSESTGSNFIYFHTPRNGDREFVMDEYGLPDWQRTIAYGLDSNSLYRYEYFKDGGTYRPLEKMSSNVEELRFGLVNDMISIHIRTFTDSTNKTGHVSKTYSEFHTMIKLRN